MLTDLNLLIAEDDRTTADGIIAMLKRLGATKITVAATGEEAFALLGKHKTPFDCVLADVRMPDGSGLELLHRIRTAKIVRGFRPDMCVVLMSGTVPAALASAAKQLDVNAFLLKPFTVHGLHTTMASARNRVFPLNQQKYAQVSSAALNVD